MAKRRKLQRQHATQRSSGRSAQKSKVSSKPTGDAGTRPSSNKQHRQQQHDAATIPFKPNDRILLIGEGDLSFAASIIRHHGCTNVTATVLEKNHAELVAKYPAVDGNIAVVNRRSETDPELRSGPDADVAVDADSNPQSDDADSDSDDNNSNHEDGSSNKLKHPVSVTNKLVYGVDAKKLPASITRTPHNHILFNFPHVGGKSTDVNRQVRHNQELLVSFFNSALSSPSMPLAPGGTIVVTLFEAEPYTLWNIRDLGRHAGLQVERSFRFQASAYPGYHHARTLGVVKNKKGQEGGGWKGEERAARSYVFMRKEDAENAASKKRRRDDDSSSDED